MQAFFQKRTTVGSIGQQLFLNSVLYGIYGQGRAGGGPHQIFIIGASLRKAAQPFLILTELFQIFQPADKKLVGRKNMMGNQIEILLYKILFSDSVRKSDSPVLWLKTVTRR